MRSLVVADTSSVPFVVTLAPAPMPATVLVLNILTLAEPPTAVPCCEDELVPNRVSHEKLPPILIVEVDVAAVTTMSLAQLTDVGAPPKPEAARFDDQHVPVPPHWLVPLCVSVAPLPTQAVVLLVISK